MNIWEVWGLIRWLQEEQVEAGTRICSSQLVLGIWDDEMIKDKEKIKWLANCVISPYSIAISDEATMSKEAYPLPQVMNVALEWMDGWIDWLEHFAKNWFVY